MKIKAIRSSWWEASGHRLDCQPYLAGALETRITLAKLAARKDKLNTITAGYDGGIYNGPKFSRTYVDSAEFGVPFVGSSSMMQADLSDLAYLSKREASSNKLRHLELKRGMTLISCSGTIGKTAFARSEMEGMWASQHIMKVVPDPTKVPPGYLYAYLSSSFGIPLVVSGTYGSIIQSIEPGHILDLPVPRLGPKLEGQVHGLVEEAADARTQANAMLTKLKTDLQQLICPTKKGWTYTRDNSFAVGESRISPVGHRLDPFHYVGYVKEGYDALGKNYTLLEEVADAVRPQIFKRIKVEGDGIEFLGGIELQTLEQESDEKIAKFTRGANQYIVRQGMVLFQCSGQRYGIFGRPLLVNRRLAGKAVSEHAMRITPHDKGDAGYLAVYFATEVGRRCVLAFSSGTSIPGLQDINARKIRLFWPDPQVRHRFATEAEKAYELRAKGTDLEKSARTLVENEISRHS